MDNEVSKDLRQYFEDLAIQFQLLKPHMHLRNAAERDVKTFKKNFIAALCTVEPRFTLYVYDRLLPQDTMALSMLG